VPYDVAELREHFPALQGPTAYFDGPGGTQTPRVVGAAVADTLTGPLSNRGLTADSQLRAERAVEQFRLAYADFLGAAPGGIVYGRSATQLTYDLSRAIARTWRPGDEVVVSRLDHDCNVRPWIQAAERAGATVRWLDFDPATSELWPDSVASAITPRTRLVAVTGASNLIGTRPPVRAIADAAHAVGALVYVDGVHYAAHVFVDVAELGADLFVCSPYKLLGPHCGVLAAAPALLSSLDFDKLRPATNEVPERFELGTLPYEVMAGATAAVDFLAGIVAAEVVVDRRARLAASYAAIEEHESRLLQRLEDGLSAFGDAVTRHSRAASRTPTLLLTFPGRKSWDAFQFLAGRDVLAPAGSFYAYEPFRRLAVDDEHGLRLGLAPYTNDDDITRVVQGLAAWLAA
jgi:cysteine desulfurase family protein (TIGR01976 family)